MQSAERISQSDISDNYVFQRSILAYHRAAGIVSGDVLEIGTGNGYGISIISPEAGTFVTVDKHRPDVNLADYPNVAFIEMKAPPLKNFASNSFDYVIMFQVIEHIKNDIGMIREIWRVLRPGGRLLISTPNRNMSLTRNPWHVREYTPEEFSALIGTCLKLVSAEGVFGNEKITEYYRRNKESVDCILRFDILGMQKWLPAWMLKIPYDIMNRLNRRSLLARNRELTSGITMGDYYFAPAGDDCFDLFYIAEK